MLRSGRVSPGRDHISPQAYRVMKSWNGAVNVGGAGHRPVHVGIAQDLAADRYSLGVSLRIVHGRPFCSVLVCAASAAATNAPAAPR